MEKELEEMRAEIIRAYKNGEVSKRDLGDMRTLDKIIAGSTVKPSAIKLVFSKLARAREKQKSKDTSKVIAARAKKNITENKSVITEKETEPTNQEILQTDITENKSVIKSINKEDLEILRRNLMAKQMQIETLNKSVKVLQESVKSLETRLSIVESKSVITEKESVKPVIEKPKKENILGWTLSRDGKRGYYYAVKMLNGKLTSIYLGAKIDRAEDKIKAWLAKRPEIAKKMAGKK